METHEWHDEPPKEDGDYFYTGLLPNGEEIMAIAHIFMHPKTQKRMAYIFIPPGWRGDMTKRRPVMHFGELNEWRGKWSGPEFGLCCAKEREAI